MVFRASKMAKGGIMIQNDSGLKKTAPDMRPAIEERPKYQNTKVESVAAPSSPNRWRPCIPAL